MKLIKIILLVIAITCLGSCSAVTTEPLSGKKVLYVTSVGWFHDYQAQQSYIVDALEGTRISQVDVIVDDISRLKETSFSEGYDLLIYNFCHAAQRDSKLVESLIKPVADEGIPLIVLHCAMHSFQFSPQWHDFLGLKTLRHEHQRSFKTKLIKSHPINAGQPDVWKLATDELYITESYNSEITPLINAYGIETKRNHIQAWEYVSGEGTIIATTLGHNESTLADLNFKRFIQNSANYLLNDTSLLNTTKPKVNLLTQDVAYPNTKDKSCVIQNMFRIGGEAVNSCIRKNCTNENEQAECEQQCRVDNSWPVPESLWPLCKSGQLTTKNK